MEYSQFSVSHFIAQFRPFMLSSWYPLGLVGTLLRWHPLGEGLKPDRDKYLLSHNLGIRHVCLRRIRDLMLLEMEDLYLNLRGRLLNEFINLETKRS
jgi:hypothetical protein